jgi:hypothetical protein
LIIALVRHPNSIIFWYAQNKLLSSSLIVIGSSPSHQRTIVAARLVPNGIIQENFSGFQDFNISVKIRIE